MQEYQLAIGEQAHLRKSAFFTSWAVVYAGMPSEGVFSLAVNYGSGYQAMSFNLYIPVTQREVKYLDWRITVLDVRPERIRLKIEKI